MTGREGNVAEPGRALGDMEGDHIIHVAAGEVRDHP
jgi:hypothetical protein